MLDSLSRLALLMLCVGCASNEPSPAAAESADAAKPAEAEAEPAPPSAELKPRSVSAPVPPAVRPIDPEWRLVEVGDGCSIRVAQAPAALDMPMKWAPCSDGTEGCREHDGEVESGGPLSGYRLSGYSGPAGITVVATIPLPGPLNRVMVGPVDGLPFLAVEAEPSERCSLGSFAMGDDEGVFEVAYDGRDGYASRAYFQGPLGSSPRWSTVAARMLRRDHPRFVGESIASVGDRLFALGSGGPLLAFDAKTERWTAVAGTVSVCCMDAPGDVLALQRPRIPEVVVGSRLGSAAVPLLQPPEGEGVSAVRFDGERAVWVHGRGRDSNNEYRSVELWTGRVDLTPAIVDRRRVADVGGRHVTPPVVGGGMAVVWASDRTSGHPTVIRLEDGARWEIPSKELRRVLWIGDGELGVELGPPGNVIGPMAVRRLYPRFR